MALAGKVTDRREVPHEPGHFFTFQTISGPQADEADLAGTKRASETLKALPESILNRQMSQDEEESIAGKKASAEREFQGYDKATLAKYGIKVWECSRGACPVCHDSYAEPVTPETVAALDKKTLDWAARVVFEMNVRPFGTGSESGSSSSTEGERTSEGTSPSTD